MKEKSKEEQQAENRRAPRIKGALAEYSRAEGAGSRGKAFIRDICIYGVGLYVPEKIDVNTILYLDIYLVGADMPLKVKGRVVWQKRSDYAGYNNLGLEFSEMTADDRKKLRENIDHYQENKDVS